MTAGIASLAPIFGPAPAHFLLYLLVIGALVLSLGLSLQSAHTLSLMLYAWDHPQAYQKAHIPPRLLPPQKSFTVILPARHEEQVIQVTLERIARSNYPPSLLEIVVVCSADDTGTIEQAQRKIQHLRADGIKNARVVRFEDGPINKPHGLNVGVRRTHHEVVAIFDAEDDIHPDIFNVVNTLMLTEQVHVIQGGIQLMDFQSHWYSALNVLEYFFWFKSCLPYHARRKSLPLGGNTVFLTREVLRRVGGWDEWNLTEDADLGIRLSCLGAPMRVVYYDRYVTREETPPTLGQFIRQRTRWSQGFLQTLLKGDWLRLPTLGQRLSAFYSLALPSVQALLGGYFLASLIMVLTLKVPIVLALVLSLPFYLLVAQAVFTVIGLYAFTSAHGLQPTWKTPLLLLLTYLPYQWVLAYASLRATWRQVRGIHTWEKTQHVGAHRQALPTVDLNPSRDQGRRTEVPKRRKATAKPREAPPYQPWITPVRDLEQSLSTGAKDRVPLPGSPARPESHWGWSQFLLLLLALVSGALAHGYHLFLYPLYVTDEGIYMQQAWAVLRAGRLSPYTYFYDHAPAGWLVISGWVSVLPSQFQTFGNAINTGRVLMLLAHVASVFLLFQITYRFSGRTFAAVVATFLFNCSPLAIFYQREVLLDNLLVFWLLLSLWLLTRDDGRIVTPMFSGLAFGIGVLTKENAIFFGPVFVYFLSTQVGRNLNARFALGAWCYSSLTVISFYVLYATLNNELLPSHFTFDLNHPPTDHVALLYTIWWQLHRSQGSLLDPHSFFWFVLGVWRSKDSFLLVAGAAAVCVNFLMGLRHRLQHRGSLVVALLAASYTCYLVRGSVLLEFYIVPLIPLLAMNIGLLASALLRLLWRLPWKGFPHVVQGLVFVTCFGVLLSPIGSYFLVQDEFGKVVPHDLYKLALTWMQAEQVAFIRQHIPTTARIIMDEELWVDLHDVAPSYPYAHSHWKAAADPEIRDTLFLQDWHRIDYIVLSNQMVQAMQQNNGDGRENWILESLQHAQRIWDLKHGGIELQIYQVDKQALGSNKNGS